MAGPRERYVLTLEVVDDPLARTHPLNRSGPYRLRHALKLLLRQFGLRCKSVGPDVMEEDLSQ